MREIVEKFRAFDNYQLHFATERATRLIYQKHVRPGEVVVDCGAGLGEHTRPLATIVGPMGLVHAFEPNPDHFAKLIAIGGNVRLWPFAVGNALSVETLRVPVGLDGWASLVDRRDKLRDKQFVSRTVLQVRLDDLPEVVDRTLRFVKIDVETRELHALQGMLRLLERDRPLVILEDGTEQIRELCSSIGYSMRDFFNRPFNPLDSVLVNCVALPRELQDKAIESFMLGAEELKLLYEKTIRMVFDRTAGL